MKIDGIGLPNDWRDLIEELCDGSSLMLDDHSLQQKLKDAGYAETSVFRRGAITGTEKLKEWYVIHKDDQPPTYPHTFEQYWLETPNYDRDVTSYEEVARAAWNAACVRGDDID